MIKTIALIDTLWDGHHPVYLKIFSKVLLELGYDVISFCPDPVDIKNWIFNNYSAQDKNRFYAFKLDEPKLNLPQSLKKAARFSACAKELKNVYKKNGVKPELVFFSYLDNYIGTGVAPALIDGTFNHKWSGLYFHPSHLRINRKYEFIRQGPLDTDSMLHSSNCHAVAVLDEGIEHKLESKINKPVIVFPDFIDDSQPDMNYNIIDQIEKKTEGKKAIGIIGALQRRKGVITLLQTAEKLIDKDYVFVFAGKLYESDYSKEELAYIKKIKQQNPPNCFFHFDYIPDEAKFNALISICDILYVAYDRFPSSSNLLTKAAVFKKPVIVSKGFCMEERVKNFNMGISIDYGNVSQCADAIDSLINNPVTPDYDKYQKSHSQEQLYKSFKMLIEKYE